jgi:hypothetical protein
MVRDAAQKGRQYITNARQAGLTWVRVGEALNLRPVQAVKAKIRALTHSRH